MRGDGTEKQIPLCVPRPPKCGGKEKARDSVRDGTRWKLLVTLAAVCVADTQPRSGSAASGAKALAAARFYGGAEAPPFRLQHVCAGFGSRVTNQRLRITIHGSGTTNHESLITGHLNV
jgi:hypothetical protein